MSALTRDLQNLLGGILTPEWIAATQTNHPTGSRNDLLTSFLWNDLSETSKPTLPAGWEELDNHRLDQTFILQVYEIIDIAAPARDRYKPSSGRRCLKLKLSDGRAHAWAIELHPVRELNSNMPLGLKLAVRQPIVHNGLMMLMPGSVHLLGGQIPELEAARQRLLGHWNKDLDCSLLTVQAGRSVTQLMQEAYEAAWPPDGPPINSHIPPPAIQDNAHQQGPHLAPGDAPPQSQPLPNGHTPVHAHHPAVAHNQSIHNATNQQVLASQCPIVPHSAGTPAPPQQGIHRDPPMGSPLDTPRMPQGSVHEVTNSALTATNPPNLDRPAVSTAPATSPTGSDPAVCVMDSEDEDIGLDDGDDPFGRHMESRQAGSHSLGGPHPIFGDCIPETEGIEAYLDDGEFGGPVDAFPSGSSGGRGVVSIGEAVAPLDDPHAVRPVTSSAWPSYESEADEGYLSEADSQAQPLNHPAPSAATTMHIPSPSLVSTPSDWTQNNSTATTLQACVHEVAADLGTVSLAELQGQIRTRGSPVTGKVLGHVDGLDIQFHNQHGDIQAVWVAKATFLSDGTAQEVSLDQSWLSRAIGADGPSVVLAEVHQATEESSMGADDPHAFAGPWAQKVTDVLNTFEEGTSPRLYAIHACREDWTITPI